MSTMYKVYSGGILYYHGEDIEAASAAWVDRITAGDEDPAVWLVPNQRWGKETRLA